MYMKYQPDKLFFWNTPRCSFWAAPGAQRTHLSLEGRPGVASLLPPCPSQYRGLQSLLGDTETVPQVQEVMSPLLCLQACSSTKHPRICSPLATAALSHRELRYQHCPETDPPTAMGSQAGKVLWGPAPCTGDLPHPPALASPADKSELWALSPQSPWEHKLGVSSPCSLMPVWPPLALWCPAMTAVWAGRAAAVSPPPASLLPGSRVSSRARLCRPLDPGSGFLLQLPAALTAPRLETASSSMEAGSLAQPAPKQPKVMGLAGAVGQDLGPGQLERESLNPGCCCDGARVWDLKKHRTQDLTQPWVLCLL